MAGVGETAAAMMTAEQEARYEGVATADAWQSGWTNWWQGFWNGDDAAETARDAATQRMQPAGEPVDD